MIICLLPTSTPNALDFLLWSHARNYLITHRLQRCNRWSLGMDEKFHSTRSNRCCYLSMLWLRLILVSERDLWKKNSPSPSEWCQWVSIIETCAWEAPGPCNVLVMVENFSIGVYRSPKCWLPAWWALRLLWWPLTDAAKFQCVYGYLQSKVFFSGIVPLFYSVGNKTYYYYYYFYYYYHHHHYYYYYYYYFQICTRRIAWKANNIYRLPQRINTATPNSEN